MNKKLFLVSIFVVMLVLEPTEAGWFRRMWGGMKKFAKSPTVRKYAGKALNFARNIVAEKLGATPEEVGEMPFDEFMDVLNSE